MRKMGSATAHVLMCGDAGYFQHIAACLISLSETNPDTRFLVVVLATSSTAADDAKLTGSFGAHRNVSVNVQAFDAAVLEGLPLGPGYYPPEIYARFWVEHYFPKDVERVLYLDGDMVIVGSVAPLLEMPLDGAVLAAVQIPGSLSPQRLGYDPSYGYFNSGVMVINLLRWRELQAERILIQAAHDLAPKLNDPDQDVLNYCFHDQVIRLDYIWNAISPFFRKISVLALSESEMQRTVRDVRIVHFNGPGKPWHYLCFHPYAKTYLACVKKTAWSDFRPRDHTLINIFKKKIITLIGERGAAALSNMIRRKSA